MYFAPQNGVYFFDILTSKSTPRPSIFNTFYFQMCFAPQRRALFVILTSKTAPNPSVFNTFYFQMCSFLTSQLPKAVRSEVFCTFSLPNRLCATTACNFSSLISPDVSAPAALASLLFNFPESQNHEKPSASRLSYLFAYLHLLSSDLYSSPCWLLFHLSILSEIWLLNFLRLLCFWDGFLGFISMVLLLYFYIYIYIYYYYYFDDDNYYIYIYILYNLFF